MNRDLVAQATYLMKGPATRGTTNGNVRGGSEDRRRRREWLVATYRANRDVTVIRLREGTELIVDVDPGTEGSEPACRCYRCGQLLTVSTVTVDRIKPGCQGGTYRRENCRPACGRCNSETGGAVRGKIPRRSPRKDVSPGNPGLQDQLQGERR